MGADHPVTVGRLDLLGRPGCTEPEHLVQSLRTEHGELSLPARADLIGRRRAQFERRQGRAQVEAGAAHDDRRCARLEQGVDLRMRKLGVLPDAEGRVYRQERNEPVFEPAAVRVLRRRP